MHWELGRELSSQYLTEYMVRIFIIGLAIFTRSRIGPGVVSKLNLFTE